MNVTIKAERVNFCETVNLSLAKAGYSSVKVCNAVNGELQGAKIKGNEVTTKTGSFTNKAKKQTASASVSASFKLEAKVTMPSLFDEWAKHMERAQKVVGIMEVVLPEYFTPWLGKFAGQTEKDLLAA